jgi:S-DNA-T family DNA segregation ATPase FtsK/SpoIIIE
MKIPFMGGSKPRSRNHEPSWLKPQTRRAIIGVCLIFFALLESLSFFQAAGPTGVLLLALLRQGFGFAAYLLPIACAWVGMTLLMPSFPGFERGRTIGLLLVVVGLLGSLHLVGVAPEDAYQTALDGKGGGLLGFAVSFPLSKAFSSIASMLIFIGAFLVGCMLTFNLSFGEVWLWIKEFIPFGRTKTAGEEGQEEGEGDEAAPLPTFRVSSMRLPAGNKPDPQQLQLQEAQLKKEQEQKEKMQQQFQAANRRYVPPAIEILHSSVGKPDSGNVGENKKKIETSLESFGIKVTMGKVNIGPTVTQYTLHPEEGIKLARITALQNDLALALAAHPIRIEAPIPNTNLVGIEIPNKDVSLVRLRDLIAAREFKTSPSPLTIAMGKDVSGRVNVAGIDRMPHLLIAGATGSGKSIFINTLIISLLYRNSPSLVRFILVDPKRVELSVYNNIPHLLTPVIVDPEKTINALRWATKEMDRRYRILSESGARNLMSFNTNNPDQAMPMIVIVIDELADLMSTHARDVEGAIVRLSQMARAIGIHLVLATQRPSVNVITGLIKANIPARVAFNVASQIDSRTILDMAGAEKLLGSGDMLYLPGDRARPVRIQAGFVSEEEVHQVVEDVKKKNPAELDFDDAVVSGGRDSSGNGGGGNGGSEDALFEEAKRVVTQSGKASASLLQRRLRVGYARAARLLDMLQEEGVISEGSGNKPREVLVAAEGGDGFGRPDTSTNVPIEDTYEDVPPGPEEEPW